MTAYEIVARPERDQLGEGPFWDQAAQVLWWVDIVGRLARRMDPASGEIRRWALPRHCSAVLPTQRGDVIVALTDGLHRLDLQTGALAAFARPDADAGNRSNECRCDPQGRIWLGTMCNNLRQDGSPLPIARHSGGLFCVEADGGSTRMLDGVGISNTLCWSPEGDRLYFADTTRETIWVFPYTDEGPRLGERRVFVQGGPGHPDGSAMDEDGCLWNARWGGGRVIRFTPEGKVDREIMLPVTQPSSCAFGGPDRRTLYVTSARQELEGLAPNSLDGALFAVPMDVKGLPMTRFAG